MRRIGRPMKYDCFLQLLEDEVVYTPASIVLEGEKAGLFSPDNGLFEKELTGAELRQAKFRVRHSLSRLQKNHFFPKIGDGVVMMKGQPLFQGWHGKRWKSTLG